MNKWFFLVLNTLAFSWLILFSGCNSKNATTGTLTIQVMDYATNTPVTNQLVYIATSYGNLKNHNWVGSLYTDGNGKAFFHDLPPVLTFYDTEHWENYGANQVYAGIDENVILFVDTPFVPKK